MSDTDSDLVSILVPKLHLKEIYGFISTLDGAATSGASQGKKALWPPDLVRRQFDESPDIIKRFQKVLANHPGEKFLTSDLASQLNAEKGSKTIAGALGAYGRRTANRYKMETWPFECEWNHTEGQQSYWMSANVAAIIKGR